jgi:hypothetical protein
LFTHGSAGCQPARSLPEVAEKGFVNSVAVARGKYTGWVGLLALLPLALLLFTGLYLFALPYASKWRSG